MQWHAGRETCMCVANECLSVCRPTPFMPKALAALLIARSAFLGSTAVTLSVVKTRPISTQVEAALSRSPAWLALTDRNSPTVAGDRGTSRRERSVLGSLMTRGPLTRESVPRTRRRPLVRSTSDQRRAAPHHGAGSWRRAGAPVAHTASPSPGARSKVETDSALERLRTKDVRRAMSPFDAPVPVNAAGIRELGPPMLFRRPASRGRSADVRLVRSYRRFKGPLPC